MEDHNEDFPIPDSAAPDMNHVAGAYDRETRLQCCVVCGGIIQNNRDTRFVACHPPDKNVGHSHWAEGPIYIVGGNPRYTSVGRDETLPDCTPL